MITDEMKIAGKLAFSLAQGFGEDFDTCMSDAYRAMSEAALAGHAAVDGWRPIELAKPGEHLLYFPPETGRNSQPHMMRVDRYPVSYPRQPTHFMAVAAPPKPNTAESGKEASDAE